MAVISVLEKKKACGALATIIMYALQKREKKKRKVWTRKWLLRRKALGCYENLMRELALEDSESYRRWLRMDVESFQFLLEKVEPLIQRMDTNMRQCISAGERLALTLRYLATGETQTSLSFQFRIAQNTISGIIPAVCMAICQVLQNDFLKVPDCPEEWRKVADNFLGLWNFPMCLGALDGKHISISPPPKSGSAYYNYKHFFSIVLMALVDANLNFVYVDIGTNGRVSDGGVWEKCSLNKRLHAAELGIPGLECIPGTNIAVPYVIVADDAFPLEQHIMKPYSGQQVEITKRIFNYRLSRARRVSENAFGILASRFRIFRSPISTSPAKAKQIVLATCCLHNFLRSKCKDLYSPMSSLDHEDIESRSFHQGTWRNDRSTFLPFVKRFYRGTTVAKEVRNRFTNYFNGPGSVSWQRDMCDLH